MPIGLGLAASHAGAVFATTEEAWDQIWHVLSLSRGVPQPAANALETGDKLKDMIARIDAAHKKLTEEFDRYKPDLLIIIGGDQSEMFDRSNVPQLMIFTGPTAFGAYGGNRQGPEAPQVHTDIDVDYSRYLLKKLVKEEGYDVGFSAELQNFGPRGYGLPHAFTRILSYIIDNTKVPTVLIYENTYDPPSLSAKRCYDFGRTLARITKNDPRRIAVFGSGGLAHDPGGKRSGWIDEPLDRWFLDKIASGDGKATQALYSFDSDAVVGGTGEIRAWITVAGAMEEMGSHGATVVDYIPAGKAATGLSMAYWLTKPAMAGAR